LSHQARAQSRRLAADVLFSFFGSVARARRRQTNPLDLVEPPLRLVTTSTAVADSILRIADRGERILLDLLP